MLQLILNHLLYTNNKDWKVVTLENDYIKLWVLPEVGGKVWGAIEKSTGEEFLYKNEVLKFRNIAMRGPWTSGGIEFNFGIIVLNWIQNIVLNTISFKKS